MKRALVAFIAKVEGVVEKIFLGASPPDPLRVAHCFLAPQSKICSAVSVFHRQLSFKFGFLLPRKLSLNEKWTSKKPLLPTYRRTCALRSAGHHSVLQGKNHFHPSKNMGLVTPLSRGDTQYIHIQNCMTFKKWVPVG